jgi:integrase
MMDSMGDIRRDKGSGSAPRQLPDGSFQARYTDPRTHKRYSVYGRSPKEAAKARDDALAEVAKGMTPGDRQTVEQFMTRWLLDVARLSLRPRSYERYAGLTNRYLIPELGKKKLSRLSAQDIASLYADRMDAGASPASVHYLHAVLHSALEQAVAWRLIAVNPSSKIKKPRKTKTEIRPFTPQQVQALTAGIAGKESEVLIVVALRTGMRLGELAGLRWSDLDEAGAVLHVRRELYRHKGRWMVDEPKTAKMRGIAVTAATAAMLRGYRLARAEALLRIGHRLTDDDLIFTGPDGQPLDWEHFTERRFRPLLASLGLPARRFHDIRHTYATLMLAAGVNAKVVSEALGHTTVEMTLNTYSHVLPTMQADAARALEALLGGISSA